jgi:FAD/FMN-containing dehydrogenase
LGTLGVIVEASVKLFPKPPERATFTMRAGTLDVARDLRREILRSPVGPLRLVLLDSTARALLDDAAPTHAGTGLELWIELGGSHRVIERCMLELRQIVAAVGAPLEHLEAAEDVWQRLCNPIPWLQPKYRDMTVLKAALPLVASEDFVSRAKQAAEAERLAVASVAQVGVGIVHLYVLDESLHANVPGWVARMRQAAADLRGTLVVEHCPVELKELVDIWGAGGDDLGAMRKLKAAWDPNDVLSPGRFLGF